MFTARDCYPPDGWGERCNRSSRLTRWRNDHHGHYPGGDQRTVKKYLTLLVDHLSRFDQKWLAADSANNRHERHKIVDKVDGLVGRWLRRLGLSQILSKEKPEKAPYMTHPSGLMYRYSHSGNLQIVEMGPPTTAEMQTPQRLIDLGLTIRRPTDEEWGILGIAPYHKRKIGPPLTQEQRREVFASEAMIRAIQDAPAWLTDDEIDEIGDAAFLDAYHGRDRKSTRGAHPAQPVAGSRPLPAIRCGDWCCACDDCQHEWHLYGTINGRPDYGCQLCGATRD